MSRKIEFAGGRNVAMKVPTHQWEATVHFYKEVLGLRPIEDKSGSAVPAIGFAFGGNQLWIDRVDGLSQAELWLEVTTDDVAGAARHLAVAGIARRDEIEPLPDGLDAFWVSSPCSIIHLAAKTDQSF